MGKRLGPVSSAILLHVSVPAPGYVITNNAHDLYNRNYPVSENEARRNMSTDSGTELPYMELLNDIASGEMRAGIHLAAWAGKTGDPELKSCLSLVADRETSHYHIFKRRISELGSSWKENDAPEFEERLRVSSSDMADVEKIRWGKAQQAQRQGPTIQARYEAAIADETVDPLTRSLLRWFSDVEADSGSLLRLVYDGIEAQAE